MIVGMDLGSRNTHICLLDPRNGATSNLISGSTPEDVLATLQCTGKTFYKVAMESGSKARALYKLLNAAGYCAIIIDARHAAPFLREIKRVKNDANDAFAIAELVRREAYRAIWIRSDDAAKRLALMHARDALIRAEVALRNTLVSQLADAGITIKAGSRRNYLKRLAENALILEQTKTLNALYKSLIFLACEIEKIEKHVNTVAQTCPITKLLMTVPGVGPITANWYRGVIDDPRRFRQSRDVGPFVGLVPGHWESGIVRKQGAITKQGSTELRQCLYLAAQIVLFRSRRESRLRTWATSVAERRGKKCAIVALARKLAVIMHAVWHSGHPYREYSS